MPEDQLTLHCFPSSDEEFRNDAHALLAVAGPDPKASEAERVAFEARLRARYPHAAVRVRDALASLCMGDVWYVYRESPQTTSEGWRVLIVEDDEDLARVMAEAIAAEGAEVRSAADGESALTATERWRPDTIVLDLGLPKLDGPGFAERYRGRAGDVPIVIVSGAPDASATSRQIGARGWLPKPFELDELIELVHPSSDQAPAQPQ